jgi:hypothetical protein
LLTLCLSAALLLLASVVMGGMSVYDLVKHHSNSVEEMINAVVFGFEMLVVSVCAWFVLQKARGLEQADQPIQLPFSNSFIFAVLGIVIPALALGGLVAYKEIKFLSWVILPLLTVIVIVLPVWLLIGIGGNGINLGARWRFFSVFGLGMTVGPFVMIVLEFVLLIFGILAGLLFAATQPGLLDKIFSFVTILRREPDQEVVLQMLAPYLLKPGVIAAALVYVAMLVPLIEELCKPLAVWLFAKSIETPAQGFVLGLLSGAAFAVLESLNASADGSATWSLIVSVRAGTTLLHITASGLVGWGIVSMFRDRKILRFFAAYLSAASIHGLWNACALIAGLSSVNTMTGDAEWLSAMVPAALGGMFMLGIGMFYILVKANRKLRGEEKKIV